MAFSEPSSLSQALTQLIALRGYNRFQGNQDLQTAWATVAGPAHAAHSRPLKISRGVLQVRVDNAPLMNELMSFHGPELVRRLQAEFPSLKIKQLKFTLK